MNPRNASGRNQWGDPQPVEARFMTKIDFDGECWIWTGNYSNTGYPTFNPRPGIKSYAARWILEFTSGRELERLARLAWACGDHRCVRPSHLSTEVFWSRVTETNHLGCWIYTGFLHGRYGRFNGVLAHRYAYEQLRGEIPDGLHLDHLCETPACVNPWHLEPVPRAENSRRNSPEYRDRANARPTLLPQQQKAA